MALVNAAISQHGFHILCSAHVHCITNPAHYAMNQASKQQAEEAEPGKHLEKQRKNEATLTAEDELAWARERFSSSEIGERGSPCWNDPLSACYFWCCLWILFDCLCRYGTLAVQQYVLCLLQLSNRQALVHEERWQT